MSETDEAAQKAEQEAAAAKAAADKAAADAEAARKAEADKLGEGGKAALDAERKRAKDAEKALKDAQAKLKEIEDAQLSEQEKLKKEAEEGKALAATATATLQKANLRIALASTEGIADPKAAAGLITGVEYDADGEPTNLADRVTALLADYPVLKGTPAKPKAPRTGAGEGLDEQPEIKLTAEELEAAKSTGHTAGQYQALKSVKTLADYERVTAKK